MPLVGSEEWTLYWTDQLFPHEMIDNFPSTDGLRRLFRTYFGTVSNTDMQVIQAPTQDQPRATVKCVIHFKSKRTGLEEIISDVADCFWGNTKRPFCDHATATAATIAEGRCYRKAMFLRTITQEESLNPTDSEFRKMSEEHDDNMPATDNQKNAILRITNRIGIDIEKMMRYMNEDNRGLNTDNINTLSSREAKILLNQVNKWQREANQGGEVIPEVILTGQSTE